jgi:hypothetical protein
VRLPLRDHRALAASSVLYGIAINQASSLLFLLSIAAENPAPKANPWRREPKCHEFELLLERFLVLPELKTVASCHVHDALRIRKVLFHNSTTSCQGKWFLYT